ILPLILSAKGIKVPVTQNDDNAKQSPIKKADDAQNSPIYYVSDGANVDSYLIPPDPHRPEEILSDVVVTPATYLLPPSQGKQTDYYYTPTEPGEQTDWYPIAENAPSRPLEAIPIYQDTNPEPIEENPRRAKAYEQRYNVPVPSLNLEPPLEDAPNEYFTHTSSEQLQVPESAEDYDFPSPIESTPKKELPLIYRPKVEPLLPQHLIPPQPYILKKYPKKLYPKKFSGEFKPVPIPIAQYDEESATEIPRAKPVKLFKPLPSTEIDYLTPADEKINYLYRKAENKRNKLDSSEQETSESFRPPGRNVYPAPLKQAPPKAPKQEASSAPAPDERTEFRMHGMKGPHSYQKNRQFRYEERENDGQVKGHYGYMDRTGKLRVVNYSAHPDKGFHADAPVVTES
ncbi:putative cuticle protein, partial [Operophtera brumata]